jgi:hypothetical protein
VESPLEAAGIPTRRSWDFVDLVSVTDGRGTLTAFEDERLVGFQIRRAFFVHDVPIGSVRGQHASGALEVLVCPSGSVDVDVDDGLERAHLRLDDPARALVLAPMVWVELRNFSPGAILLALASEPFESAVVVRDYATFIEGVGRRA